MRALLLGSVATLALVLAACDGGSPGPVPPDPDPIPTACGAVAARTDTLFVAVGDSTALDLDALFAGVEGGPFRYSLTGTPPWNGAVALRGDRGQAASVRAAAIGARSFTLTATATCGGGEAVAGRAVVALHAVRPGTVCTVPSRAVSPTEPLRFAAGGVGADLLLWGEGGLFEGPFNEDTRFTYASELATGSTVVVEGGPPQLRLVPRSQAGTGDLVVTATDGCFRRVATTAAVPFELIASPTCSLDYDPTSVDYLPLDTSARWVYDVSYNSAPPYQRETWSLYSQSECYQGVRTFYLPEIGTVRVRGNYVDFPAIYITNAPRLLPSNGSPPAEQTFRGGGGIEGWDLTLRRGVGVAIYARTRRGPGSGNYSTTRWTLVEGPIPPGARPQHATVASGR